MHNQTEKDGQFVIRVSISAIVGLLVALIACIAAWLPVRWMPNIGPKVLSTGHAFSDIESMIRRHQWDMNSGAEPRPLPQSLAELRRQYEEDYSLGWDQNSNPLDAWGRPLMYSVDGTEFTLSSFGRDG